MDDELTDEERLLLDLAKRRYRYDGAKEEALAVEFGLTATRYYQRLNTHDRP